MERGLRFGAVMRPALLLCVLVAIGCGASTSPMRLDRVVLYQSGVGYFERSGLAEADGVRLRLAAHEVDDVLTTLTVLGAGDGSDAAPSAVIPTDRAAPGDAQEILVALGGDAREVRVAYSAPTPAWRASYRLVLPDERGADDAWLQAWAVVDNSSAEDWDAVDLTLATDAPLSFAVDLRTPRIVTRPSLAGHHAPPIAFGMVSTELSTRGPVGERDHDGGSDEDDMCPEDAEDVDGFEDGDGCPDPDNDHDGILDVDDLAPNDPETYNGVDDEDGVPDRGRVVVTSSRVTVLDQIYFGLGEVTPLQRSGPVLDAVAQTLVGNPEVTRVELQGFADVDEPGPWRLSAERAAVVRAELIERGVDGARLSTRAYGSSQPLSPGSNERNRRVSFRVEVRADRGSTVRAQGVTRRSLARSMAEGALPRTGSGGTRFPVARGVSIPAGRSAMVTILHRAVSGEDVLLYRVDPNVPGSAEHPYRAARFENQSGVDLIAGPISLFARGELAGQGLLGALRAGENAFVPYALDTSTHIGSGAEAAQEPSRILGLRDGRVEVERTAIRRTTYRIEAGRHVAGRIYVRHPRAAGFEPVGLPPNTETSPSALLVPIPLVPGHDSTLVIEERRPVRGTVELVGDLDVNLTPYLAGSDLEPPVEARLQTLLDARAALVSVREEAGLLERRLGEAARRSAELRRSVRSLDERAGRSSSATRRRLGARLEAAVERAEQVADRLAEIRAREIDAAVTLREAARDLRF